MSFTSVKQTHDIVAKQVESDTTHTLAHTTVTSIILIAVAIPSFAQGPDSLIPPSSLLLKTNTLVVEMGWIIQVNNKPQLPTWHARTIMVLAMSYITVVWFTGSSVIEEQFTTVYNRPWRLMSVR